jgi:hypothetical protein
VSVRAAERGRRTGWQAGAGQQGRRAVPLLLLLLQRPLGVLLVEPHALERSLLRTRAAGEGEARVGELLEELGLQHRQADDAAGGADACWRAPGRTGCIAAWIRAAWRGLLTSYKALWAVGAGSHQHVVRAPHAGREGTEGGTVRNRLCAARPHSCAADSYKPTSTLDRAEKQPVIKRPCRQRGTFHPVARPATPRPSSGEEPSDGGVRAPRSLRASGRSAWCPVDADEHASAEAADAGL